jgi:hypothetical protein
MLVGVSALTGGKLSFLARLRPGCLGAAAGPRSHPGISNASLPSAFGETALVARPGAASELFRITAAAEGIDSVGAEGSTGRLGRRALSETLD